MTVRRSDGKAQAAAIGTLATACAAMAALLLLGPRLLALVVPTGWPAAAQDAVFALAIYGAMIVLACGAEWAMRRRVAALGARTGRNGAVGLGLGLIGIGLAVGFAWIAGGLRFGSGQGGSILLLPGVALVLFQAAAEELYFRGWIQPVLAQAWGMLPAIGVTALAFAGLHMLGAAMAPLSFINLLLGGLLFGTLAAQGGGLAGAIGAHFAWNGTEQLAIGLDPNPGIGSFGTLVDLDLVGPAAWGGSAEGLNASLAMTMALIVLLVPRAILARGGAAASSR